PQPAERAHERLLHHVLGVVAGAEQHRGPVRGRGVPGDQGLVGVQVTGAGAVHELGIVHWCFATVDTGRAGGVPAEPGWPGRCRPGMGTSTSTTRRRFLALAAGAAGTSVLAGCGVLGGGARPRPSAVPAADDLLLVETGDGLPTVRGRRVAAAGPAVSTAN